MTFRIPAAALILPLLGACDILSLDTKEDTDTGTADTAGVFDVRFGNADSSRTVTFAMEHADGTDSSAALASREVDSIDAMVPGAYDVVVTDADGTELQRAEGFSFARDLSFTILYRDGIGLVIRQDNPNDLSEVQVRFNVINMTDQNLDTWYRIYNEDTGLWESDTVAPITPYAETIQVLDVDGADTRTESNIPLSDGSALNVLWESSAAMDEGTLVYGMIYLEGDCLLGGDTSSCAPTLLTMGAGADAPIEEMEISSYGWL